MLYLCWYGMLSGLPVADILLLMGNIFTKLGQHFCHDKYVAEISQMNTLCLTENISVMQVSFSAQETLHNLIRESICIVPYLLECKTRYFPEIWCLNMWGCLNVVYPVPKRTMPNKIAQNWTIRSQANPVEDATEHLQNSVRRHTCTNICNKSCKYV